MLVSLRRMERCVALSAVPRTQCPSAQALCMRLVAKGIQRNRAPPGAPLCDHGIKQCAARASGAPAVLCRCLTPLPRWCWTGRRGRSRAGCVKRCVPEPTLSPGTESGAQRSGAPDPSLPPPNPLRPSAQALCLRLMTMRKGTRLYVCESLRILHHVRVCA